MFGWLNLIFIWLIRLIIDSPNIKNDSIIRITISIYFMDAMVGIVEVIHGGLLEKKFIQIIHTVLD